MLCLTKISLCVSYAFDLQKRRTQLCLVCHCLFSPHFVILSFFVICDLLLDRTSETWNLFNYYAQSVAASQPSKAILAHNRCTPFPLSKKGVARRNLVCDIWLTGAGGSTNGAEKEPQDWGALVADRRQELMSFKRCFFLRHV